VTDVARKHGVTRWRGYDWRKQLRNGRLTLPERVTSTPAFAALMVEEPRQRDHANAMIEVVVDGVVIRAEPGVDGDHLTRVIRAVRAAT
jgi:transposase